LREELIRALVSFPWVPPAAPRSVRGRPFQVKGAAASVRDGARATLDVRASTTRGAAADAE